MANRVQIRRGSTAPTTSNLLNYELGWDTTNKILYINNNSSIESIPEGILRSTGKALVSGDNIDTIGYGLYYSSNSTVSGTLNGTLPTTSSGFKLFSYKGYGTNWDFQAAVTKDSIKFRQENTNVWGNWYDIVTSTFSGILYIKNSGADITAASLTSDASKGIYFPDAYSGNNKYVAYITATQLTNGNTRLRLASRRRNTADTSNVTNTLDLISAADGTLSVAVASKAAWRSAIGAVNVAGDTITGQLISTCNSGGGAIIISHGTSSKEAFFQAIRTDRGDLTTSFGIGAGGTNHGVYSNGYYGSSTFTSDEKWLVYRNSSGEIILNGGAQQIITKGTVGTRSVYVTTTSSVPSGAVAGDIVLVKV